MLWRSQGDGLGNISLYLTSLFSEIALKMPARCVVYGCSNESNLAKGISLHRVPFWNDDRREAKKRRKKWLNFIGQKRMSWTATKHSAVCSVHFQSDDFEQLYVVEVPGTKPYTPRLKRDNVGITVFPTIFEVLQQPPQSVWSLRQVREFFTHCYCLECGHKWS